MRVPKSTEWTRLNRPSASPLQLWRFALIRTEEELIVDLILGYADGPVLICVRHVCEATGVVTEQMTEERKPKLPSKMASLDESGLKICRKVVKKYCSVHYLIR